MAVSVEIFQLSFHVFTCACPTVISSIFGKSFHFSFHSLILCYPYFSTFLSTWSVSIVHCYACAIVYMQCVTTCPMHVIAVLAEGYNTIYVRITSRVNRTVYSVATTNFTYIDFNRNVFRDCYSCLE
jgi:hypothetical protein